MPLVWKAITVKDHGSQTNAVQHLSLISLVSAPLRAREARAGEQCGLLDSAAFKGCKGLLPLVRACIRLLGFGALYEPPQG